MDFDSLTSFELSIYTRRDDVTGSSYLMWEAYWPLQNETCRIERSSTIYSPHFSDNSRRSSANSGRSSVNSCDTSAYIDAGTRMWVDELLSEPSDHTEAGTRDLLSEPFEPAVYFSPCVHEWIRGRSLSEPSQSAMNFNSSNTTIDVPLNQPEPVQQETNCQPAKISCVEKSNSKVSNLKHKIMRNENPRDKNPKAERNPKEISKIKNPKQGTSEISDSNGKKPSHVKYSRKVKVKPRHNKLRLEVRDRECLGTKDSESETEQEVIEEIERAFEREMLGKLKRKSKEKDKMYRENAISRYY